MVIDYLYISIEILTKKYIYIIYIILFEINIMEIQFFLKS